MLLIVATGFTLVVYLLQCGNQRRSAAIEVKEQILEIETQIKELKKLDGEYKNPDLYKLGPILTDNLWKKNMATLNKHLDETDRRLLGNFYSSAEKLERSRADLVNQMINTWDYKSLLVQLNNLGFFDEIAMKTGDSRLKPFDDFLLDERVFVPAVCVNILQNVEKFCFLEGTTTYSKLCKLSKKKLFEK